MTKKKSAAKTETATDAAEVPTAPPGKFTQKDFEEAAEAAGVPAEAVAADFAAEPEKTMARLDITARAKNGEDVSGVAGPDGEQYASPSDSGAR